jgi:hypothetical protein
MSSFFGCKITIGDSVSRTKYESDLAAAFEIMKPKPSPYPLIRIGPDADGAYLIPDDLDGVAACFSPGVSNRKDFEDHLTRTFGIKCHMCDYSSDESRFKTPLIDGMQSFVKKWLDVDHAENSIQLSDWIAELAPDVNTDLLLQIDIEGAEYRNILACPAEVLRRFRIISIELHGLDRFLDPDITEQVLLPFLNKLDASHFCVHAHPNNCGGYIMLPSLGANMPRVLELTFLRRDRLASAANGEIYQPLLPHPLDILRNVVEKPPIFLNAAWMTGEEPLLAKVKRLEDEAAYRTYRDGGVPTQLNDLLTGAFRLALRARRQLPDGSSTRPDSEVPTELDEIAAGCRYTLTSSFGNRPLSGVVPADEPAFFFHTNQGINQSITIDLGSAREIRLVTIGNRRDGCFDRAALLFLILHVEPDKDTGEVFVVDAPAGFAAGSRADARIAIPSITARYVTVVSPLHTWLHLSSLRVFALSNRAGTRAAA